MSKKAWGGRFKKATHKLVEGFSESVSYDSRLYREDIDGSIAHAKMLGRQGIITAQESDELTAALEEIRTEIEKGELQFSIEHEDIHLNIEKRLIEKTGPLGGKLHTARSRNDQIALDERLYLKREIGGITALIKGLAGVFIDLAAQNEGAVLPMYTHLQRAQPVLLSHHLLAYFEMLARDRERFMDCLGRVDRMPLGAGAGAGTSFPIDRNYVAELLGFSGVTENSIDTVSSRDFLIEFLSDCAILSMHLSRISEELVLWSSSEFDFIDLGDEFTTGSSIMPQKRNPDVAELIRGKTGRVYGSLVSLLVLMKGLPLSYNRDMQEDKEALFDAVDTVRASLEVMAAMLTGARFKHESMKGALSGGFGTATDLADYLVRKGMPFREAHGVVGSVVSHAEDAGKELSELGLDELRGFSGLFEEDVFTHITTEGSIGSRGSYGGTAPARVAAQITRCAKLIKKW